MMAEVQSPLAEKPRVATGEALQGEVVDLVDLSLLSKQLHWNVIGPNFRSIHLQLDDVVLFARTQADIMAERAVSLGVNPNGQSDEIAASTPVKTVEAGYIKDVDVVKVMVDRLFAMITRCRERIETTDESDPVTQDLIIAVCQGLEQHHWMFQAEQV
jgi:starvation-inducible DNA-binding protein